ncbi:hypothetical protein ACLBXM_15575 [Xanthobacteraceae bacterium A53D]
MTNVTDKLADAVPDNMPLKDPLGRSGDARCCMAIRYWDTRPDDDVLREPMKAMAAERRRLGHRLRHVQLRRESFAVNRRRHQPSPQPSSTFTH